MQLGKLINYLVYLHYVLCTVALTIITFGKINCIFYKVIVNKYALEEIISYKFNLIGV